MEKQPTDQCFKARGLAVDGRVATAGSTTGAIAATANEVPLRLVERLVQARQGFGLGFRPNFSHNGVVKGRRSARAAAISKPLMQLPDSIAQPSELKWAEVSRSRHGLAALDPIAQAAN